MADRSPSHDPSVDSIEDRVAVYDPDWQDVDEEDDDDDMDYQPAAEELGSEDDGFQSAEEQIIQALLEQGDVEIEIQEEDAGEDDDDEESGGNADDDDDDDEEEEQEERQREEQPRPVFISREQLLRIVRQPGLQRLLQVHSGGGYTIDDDDDDESWTPWGRRTRRSTRPQRAEFEKVPSEQGTELMMNGMFGSSERRQHRIAQKKKLAHQILRRELGLGTNGQQKARNSLLKHDFIPGSQADQVIVYDARCYSGQFSTDGNFFFSCGQDFKVRMYDTSNPYKWKYYKMVENQSGAWTITDASLSMDNKWLAFSTIGSIVCLAPTDPNDESYPRALDFSRLGPSAGDYRLNRIHGRFAIWSIRFSGDGREIVAGTGDRSVFVYDIERNHSILRIPGHQDDVNAVCFGDAASPHILYSGSDDTTLKVWDRRSLGEGRAAGVFLGHTEGLTYVDSKGDGRYIISNAKDQTAKLWDLRKVIPTDKADKIRIDHYTTGFEYRMNPFNYDLWRPHPHDCSLVTFRGHQVLKTLIRCHFSPPGSTDSRYVYSGSYDGKVYIWNLDATLKGTIDVGNATSFLKKRSRQEYDDNFWGGSSGFGTCVRDASWHPDVPMIAATSWNGWGTSIGTCSVHSWNDGLDEDDGIPGMGQKYRARLEPEPEPEDLPFTRSGAGRWVRRARGM